MADFNCSTGTSATSGDGTVTGPRKKVQLELVGLDGNAFALMGAFQKAARRQGWTADEIKVVLDECRSGDYNHLLQTLMEHTTSPDTED